jgi:hypothetical protein
VKGQTEIYNAQLVRCRPELEDAVKGWF